MMLMAMVCRRSDPQPQVDNPISSRVTRVGEGQGFWSVPQALTAEGGYRYYVSIGKRSDLHLVSDGLMRTHSRLALLNGMWCNYVYIGASDQVTEGVFFGTMGSLLV